METELKQIEETTEDDNSDQTEMSSEETPSEDNTENTD